MTQARNKVSQRAIDLVETRISSLQNEVEADMKTTTGIGIRRAIHELEELRDEIAEVLP